MTTGALLLAFDPGPTRSGWALVRRGRGLLGKVEFVRGGRMDSTPDMFTTLLRDLREMSPGEPVGTIAVERPEGYVYDPVRGAQVIATATIAGGIAWAASARGHQVVEVPAARVRKTLLGRARLGFWQQKGDMDRAIKAVLPSFVSSLPAKASSHVRDALALAVAVHWMTVGKAVAS